LTFIFFNQLDPDFKFGSIFALKGEDFENLKTIDLYFFNQLDPDFKVGSIFALKGEDFVKLKILN